MGLIIFWSAVFIVSLVVLLKSADYFTRYSERLGLILGLSSFIIGATIVAVGTSLPELVSSLYAVLNADAASFVADNIIGSNIANALLILGIGALAAKTLKVHTSLIDADLPFFFMSMALFVFFALDHAITLPEGIALLGFFIIFIIYNIRSQPEPRDRDEMESLHEQFQNGHKVKKRHLPKKLLRYIAIIIVAAGMVALSAKFLIDSLLTLSTLLNISSSTLTITVVALGTSLPEVFTSIAAIKLGNHGMAVGNVLGSNTFNLLLIGGVPALFSTLPIAQSTFAIGIPFLIIATFVVIFSIMDNKVRLWEGIAMLSLYVIFLGKITTLL